MYAGKHKDVPEEEEHLDANKFFQNDKLSLLPVVQENRYDTVVRSQVNLYSQLHVQSNQIISMLKNVEKELLHSLEQCRKERGVVREHIALWSKRQCCPRRLFSCPYCPFPKFPRFFCDIPNSDTLAKEVNHEFKVSEMCHGKKFTEIHRNTLQETILAIESGKRLKQTTREMEHLHKMLEETEDSERREEIKRRLKSCYSSDVSLKETKNLPSMLGTEYDWVNISKNVFRGQFTPHECSAMWNLYLHPKIYKGPWTIKENKRLHELVEKYKFQDWDGIAKELGERRSAIQCIVQYFYQKRSLSEGSWSEHENKLLISAVMRLKKGSDIPWHLVASYVPGRSKRQVWEHWKYSLNPSIKKGPFTKEEDRLLLAAVKKHGEKFLKVAEMFPNRTSVQLRYRYKMVLQRPKSGYKWHDWDDALLLKLVKRYGEGKWKQVSEHFPFFNRTQVRQHYNVLKKRPVGDSEGKRSENEIDSAAASSNLVFASQVKPNVTVSTSDIEEPKVCKKVPPSRKRKRRNQWLKKQEGKKDPPERTKRKYVKSGKYKKEQPTEVSEVRRSSRIASTSQCHSSIMENSE